MIFQARKLLTCLSAVVLATTSAFAEIGKLKYSQTESGPRPQATLRCNLYSPTKSNKGLVSRHAQIAKVGNFMIALDGDSEDSKNETLNKLKIDLSGEGDFTNASVVDFKYVRNPRRNSFSVRLERAEIKGVLNGHNIIMSIRFQHYLSSKSSRFKVANIAFSVIAVGKCQFGEAVYNVRLFDKTSDLKFAPTPNFKIINRYSLASVDTFEIFGKTKKYIGIVGQPINIDGKWWDINIDGMKISATPFTGKIGKINFSGKYWSALLTGKKYVLVIPKTSGEVEVPADEYRIAKYEVLYTDSPKARGPSVYAYNIRGGSKTVTVEPGKTLIAPVGDEIIVSSSVRKTKGNRLRIDVKLQDTLGTDTVKPVGKGGKRYPAPQIEIYDAQGKLVHKANLHYG